MAYPAVMGGPGSGGARLRSGPPPDLNALHRVRDARMWTRLPVSHTLPTPEWPIEVPDPTMAEIVMWNRLWSMPQALVWNADKVEDQVAIYVRTYLEAAGEGAAVARRQLARVLANDLLLTTPALHAARYYIEGNGPAPGGDPGAERQPATASKPAGAVRSIRDRMNVVPVVVTEVDTEIEVDEPEVEDDDTDVTDA